VDYDSTRGADGLKVFAPGKAPEVVTCGGGDGYVGELKHMIESIAAGRPPTVVTGADGLGAVEICEAEERSAQRGELVRLD